MQPSPPSMSAVASLLYATAVYQLSESIAGRDGALALATTQATAPMLPGAGTATP